MPAHFGNSITEAVTWNMAELSASFLWEGKTKTLTPAIIKNVVASKSLQIHWYEINHNEQINFVAANGAVCRISPHGGNSSKGLMQKIFLEAPKPFKL